MSKYQHAYLTDIPCAACDEEKSEQPKPAPVEGADRLLTDEEIADAEVIYSKEHKTGFPLHGAHRDICITQAQDAKTLSLLSTPQEGQDCGDCPFINRKEQYCITHDRPLPETDKRRDDCPRKPVPQEGLREAQDSIGYLDDKLPDGRAAIDEVVMDNALVHLEMLDDNCAYMIMRNDKHYWHLNIYHKGKSPLRVVMFEDNSDEPQMLKKPVPLLPQGQGWQDKPDKAGWWWVFYRGKMALKRTYNAIGGLCVCAGDTFLVGRYLELCPNSLWLFIPEPPAPKGETK